MHEERGRRKLSPTSRCRCAQVDERWVQNFYEEFYEDVFEEVAQFGEIENLNVCDNIADHMVGNVYIKFREEEAAAMALQVGGARGACRMPSVDHPMQGREGPEASSHPVARPSHCASLPSVWLDSIHNACRPFLFSGALL